MSDVLYLKLISGEEIVANSNVFEEGILVTDPLELHTVSRNNGAFVRLTKWIPHVATNEFMLEHKHVMFYSEPLADIRDYYLEAVIQLNEIEDEKQEENIYHANTSPYTVH